MNTGDSKPHSQGAIADDLDGVTSLRAATWNLAYRGPAVAAQLGALARHARIDIVLLQEANAAILPLFVEAAGLDWARTAYDAGAALPDDGRRPRATAIAGKGPVPTRIGHLPELRLPEKMMYACLHRAGVDLTVASFHAPPGVTWGKVKVDHALALLDWVNATPGPLILGADANTPEIDHPSRDKVRTHWHTGTRALHGGTGDDAMFGGHPQHRLQDALRIWLDHKPDQLAQVIQTNPEGPLAVSHRTGKRAFSPGTPRRFDALWTSPDFAIQQVVYDYAGGIAAGSDHALVTADLTVESWV